MVPSSQQILLYDKHQYYLLLSVSSLLLPLATKITSSLQSSAHLSPSHEHRQQQDWQEEEEYTTDTTCSMADHREKISSSRSVTNANANSAINHLKNLNTKKCCWAAGVLVPGTSR